MVKIQNQIDPDCSMESYGIIDEVYTTKKGDEIADPFKHHVGWMQVSPIMRVRIYIDITFQDWTKNGIILR